MQADCTNELSALLAERLLILDGAMGTMIQRHGLQEADYRGERFADHPHDLKGNNDLLVLTQPGIIGGIHREYLEAGADILETCTFNSTSVSQADYNLTELVYELNFEGARLARQLCDEFTAANPAKPRFVAGVLGPTSRTASISPDVNDPGYRNVAFDELVANYFEAITGQRRPTRSKKPSMANSAALALSVSNTVSTSRMSAPPSVRPRIASR